VAGRDPDAERELPVSGQARVRCPCRAAVADDRGQALVEFAVVLPILLLLIFGMIQLGLVLNARQTVAHAAQVAAAGYAQTLQRTWSAEQARIAAAQLRPGLAWEDVTYTLYSGSSETRITANDVGRPGDFVVARVTYRYPSPVRVGIAGFRFPDAIAITMEGVARIEKLGSRGR